MGAYFELYYDDVNELMGYVFQEIAAENKWNFEAFASGFMNCRFRHMMDEGSPRVFNMTYDELIEYLQKECSEIFVEDECIVDPILAYWIGDMYNRIQYYSCKTSKEIYNQFPLMRMIQMFGPLHTVDEEVAVEKILQAIK